jgi:hypothetical protein
VMTTHTHTLPPDVVAAIASDAALTDEAKIQSLATALVFEDGGPLAVELMELPMPENDPCTWSDIRNAVARRRDLLEGTHQWDAARRMLAEARPA